MEGIKKKRVVFLGSKDIGLYCLEQLVTLQGKGLVDVVAVLSNGRSLKSSKPTVVDCAESHNLTVLDGVDSLLTLRDIDLLISVQYHKILSREHIDVADRAVNLHMAPLPEYRGCNQFSFAIIDEAVEFGTTWHEMRPGIDDGPIILERRFPMSGSMQVEELYALTLDHSMKLVDEGLRVIVEGDYEATPQSDFIEQRGTSFHLRKEIEEIKKIDLNWPEEKIDRHIRATSFSGFPPPYAMVDGEKIDLDLNWRNRLK